MTESQQSLRPTNSLVTPMLTDLYQITMAYAHWKNNRQDDPSIFECFFRKNPFKGEYTIFAGLDECLKHLVSFKFSESDIAYLKTVPSLRHCDPAFFDWMLKLDTSQVSVRAIPDGTGKVFVFSVAFSNCFRGCRRLNAIVRFETFLSMYDLQWCFLVSHS